MNKTTALAKIEAAQQSGALVFVDKEWADENTPLYKPDVTEIKINKAEDCFNISGKFMPKREVVDRIGEASGVDFIFGETKSSVVDDSVCGKRTVYTAFAQGRKLMPDGSYRTSSKCDYEFDPVLRGMLDYDVTELNEQTKQKRKTGQNGQPYGNTLARYILELQKVATQRANTGARLRVIRELVGMPVALDAKNLEKPLLFGRIIQNTDYILKTPEGRAMATAKALGLDMGALFGRNKSLEAKPETPAEAAPADIPPEDTPPEDTGSGYSTADLAGQAADDGADFEDDPAPDKKEETEFSRLTNSLIDYLNGYEKELNVTTKSGKNPYKLAQDEIDNSSATLESRKSMIERLKKFLTSKGIAA